MPRLKLIIAAADDSRVLDTHAESLAKAIAVAHIRTHELSWEFHRVWQYKHLPFDLTIGASAEAPNVNLEKVLSEAVGFKQSVMSTIGGSVKDIIATPVQVLSSSMFFTLIVTLKENKP